MKREIYVVFVKMAIAMHLVKSIKLCSDLKKEKNCEKLHGMRAFSSIVFLIIIIQISILEIY